MSFRESEEDLDHLPQVGGGVATVHRRAPIPVDYSDFINDASPLSSGHQGLKAPSTWSGGLGHRKGTKSSKLPDLSHLFAPSIWSNGLGHRKGTESSKLLDFSPPFCTLNLVGRARASEGHGVLQATRPQPTFVRLQFGRASSGIGRAPSPQSYPTSAYLSLDPLFQTLGIWIQGLGAAGHMSPATYFSNLLEDKDRRLKTGPVWYPT
jgi:hypothetical protein